MYDEGTALADGTAPVVDSAHPAAPTSGESPAPPGSTADPAAPTSAEHAAERAGADSTEEVAVASSAADSDGSSESRPPADTTTAGGIAAAVQNGVLTPEQVVDAALERIRSRDRKVNAFSRVRSDVVRAEARALAERPDLDLLPLAGVPIAVKNNIDVAGEVTRGGSRAGSDTAATADHPVVRRLRSAGAIVVGLTTVPEFGLWGVTDEPGRITRSPWNTRYSAGGSSGGSGAAVGLGLVPIAHGNDGLGSVRIPAACCGVVGVKPGRGLVPAQVGLDDWGGMTENGVLATTVADAALMLSVLADQPALADLDTPPALRVGLAVTPPSPLARVDRAWTAAARKAAAALATAGHEVQVAELPYQGATSALLLRWVANAAREAGTVAYPDRLQRRTRAHIALGNLVLKAGLVRQSQVDRIEARLLDYFDHHDVVITPTLATPPPRARNWHNLPWIANVIANASYSPFTPLWNLVGWPALTVPMGFHSRTRTPVAAQLVGPPGSESTLLRLAAQLEAAHPWRRTAP
ncbi:amidase [Nocardia huaxiensis]|uniref:amidase n=1 Tax=Nocardia huaxiensis TaxID=2755382 RepID=A0A7D6ZN65_9NOCA|nr:amidase family protein [Nocardia huaxiensis]QLY31403.1 amidase [Nocardia huaxiensis]UFS94950.1 amidase [Nocardia huaxiensis]